MKWTYFVEQKIKVACLLFAAMLFIIVTDLIESRNVEKINHSVTSIYNDRLMPATDIFYLSEQLYNKTILVENFLNTDPSHSASVRRQLSEYDQQIARLIKRFEGTYLVTAELAFLEEFKDRVLRYSLIEERVLSLHDKHNLQEARILFQAEGKIAFKNSILTLNSLAKVQTAVGNELLNDSKGVLATTGLLSALQVVLAILIGLTVMALIFTSRVVNSAGNRYHLN